ncbi:hypothetical protein Tco_0425509 [Tanacetum coccineum]
MDDPNITMEEYIGLKEKKLVGMVRSVETEFPAIVFDDMFTSQIDLKDETSLSEYDEEEQNILYFNDPFPFNIIYPDDLKSDKDNDDNEIDIIQSSGDYYSEDQYAVSIKEDTTITTNRIEGEKPPGLMLPPMGILETVPYVKDAPCITWDLALSSVELATR